MEVTITTSNVCAGSGKPVRFIESESGKLVGDIARNPYPSRLWTFTDYDAPSGERHHCFTSLNVARDFARSYYGPRAQCSRCGEVKNAWELDAGMCRTCHMIEGIATRCPDCNQVTGYQTTEQYEQFPNVQAYCCTCYTRREDACIAAGLQPTIDVLRSIDLAA